MERKLNEQWVVTINGARHVLKAVEPIEECDCKGCRFFSRFGMANACCRLNDCDEYASVDSNEFLGCGYGNTFIIKDLGRLNNDGCLPSPWGGYPKIIHEVDQDRTESGEDVHYDNLWCVEIHKPVLICTDEYPTKQEAIDAWNRRALWA